jgi:hypothetical protein
MAAILKFEANKPETISLMFQVCEMLVFLALARLSLEQVRV